MREPQARGAVSEIVERLTGRSAPFGWRAWFLFGIVTGSAVFVLLGGSSGAYADHVRGWSESE